LSVKESKTTYELHVERFLRGLHFATGRLNTVHFIHCSTAFIAMHWVD